MSRISTKNINLLPSPENLKIICKSISALEAILSPDWEYRYFSYQKNWGENEECCEMRDGQGDQMLILFKPNGSVINGFAHESIMNGWKRNEVEDQKSSFKKFFGKNSKPKIETIQNIWKGVVDKLPESFHQFVFGEPVRTIGTTFCIWSNKTNNKWEIGEIIFPENEYSDGSAELLELLDGNPETYKDWAEEYYEKENLNLKLIKFVYNQIPISKEIIDGLNPELDDIDKLKADLDEIGYVYKI